MTPYALDDAAAAALYQVLSEQDTSREHMGLLYEQQGIKRTPTQTKGQQASVGGTFAIPKGSLRGLFHNHPHIAQSHGREVPRDAGARTDIPIEDRKQAKELGVPSYVAAGQKIMRYDPATGRTEEVLAQFPIDEIRRKYLAQRLLK